MRLQGAVGISLYVDAATLNSGGNFTSPTLTVPLSVPPVTGTETVALAR